MKLALITNVQSKVFDVTTEDLTELSLEELKAKSGYSGKFFEQGFNSLLVKHSLIENLSLYLTGTLEVFEKENVEAAAKDSLEQILINLQNDHRLLLIKDLDLRAALLEKGIEKFDEEDLKRIELCESLQKL